MAKKKEKGLQIKKILVPTDFSPSSEAGVEYAAAMAKQFGAEVILVHVVESFPYMITDTVTVVSYTDSLKTVAQALLDGLSSKLSKEGLSIKTHLATIGFPPGEIIKRAEREKADIIVMATHGRTGLGRLLMGSVAEKVVRLSPVPVLTVRPPAKKGKKV